MIFIFEKTNTITIAFADYVSNVIKELCARLSTQTLGNFDIPVKNKESL